MFTGKGHCLLRKSTSVHSSTLRMYPHWETACFMFTAKRENWDLAKCACFYFVRAEYKQYWKIGNTHQSINKCCLAASGSLTRKKCSVGKVLVVC